MLTAVAALSGAACRSSATPPSSDALAAAPACARRTGEKLGVPFVQVCAGDLGVPNVAFAPFWISAVPVGCSAGEHETVSCPDVLAIAHPARGDSQPPGAVPRRIAAVIDAEVAHRICTMRFAGRLPTREERARAADALGLATVVVVAGGEAPSSFAFRPLSEWVTETACDTPSLLEPRCRPGAFPAGSAPELPWPRLASCEARPRSAEGAVAVYPGGTCPAPAWDWASETLPCALRAPVGPALPAPTTVLSVSCRKPAEGARHPAPAAGIAAFRCVLPGPP